MFELANKCNAGEIFRKAFHCLMACGLAVLVVSTPVCWDSNTTEEVRAYRESQLATKPFVGIVAVVLLTAVFARIAAIHPQNHMASRIVRVLQGLLLVMWAWTLCTASTFGFATPLLWLTGVALLEWTAGRIRKRTPRALFVSAFLALWLMTAAIYPPLWLLDAVQERTGIVFHIPTNDAVVYLTLDDAPSPKTADILSLLSREQSQATFFFEGQKLQDDSLNSVARQAVRDGHRFGNHQYSRRIGAMLTENEFRLELEEFDHAAQSLGNTNWVRTANGFVNPSMLRTIRERGQTCVLGDCFPWDYLHGSSTFNVRYITSRIRPGSIIILHDGPGRAESTIETLSRLLSLLKQRGYQVKALPSRPLPLN